MNWSEHIDEIFKATYNLATGMRKEFITPEMVLYTLCDDEIFCSAYSECGGSPDMLKTTLHSFIKDYVSDVGDDAPERYPIYYSNDMMEVLTCAERQAMYSATGNEDDDVVELTHIIYGICQLVESYAQYYLLCEDIEVDELLRSLTAEISSRKPQDAYAAEAALETLLGNTISFEDDNSDFDLSFGLSSSSSFSNNASSSSFDNSSYNSSSSNKNQGWRQYAPCINDTVDSMNPLIGRKAELERTIQILCRKDKNNPLHIGEPGVGKTAITYGLAKMINEGNVPDELKDSKIYSIDLGTMLAGTQYRGEFEKRFKNVLNGIAKEKNPIIYIDEIHNLNGAGAVEDGSFDAANLLKSYLTDGTIKFIGATTFEEYKKYFEKSKSLVRRFQNVEILEPSESETIEILKGLRPRYEEFHNVSYSDEVIEYIVKSSAKYINERFLPDKAIDLLDEAGAYKKLHPTNKKASTNKQSKTQNKSQIKPQIKPQIIDKKTVNIILTNICRVPIESVETNETKGLADLEKKLKAQIYGQDEAITQVTNAVKFSRAGLQENGKPLASLLFVGPTGVGKTEIAKKLADELGVKLIRFDMSEYGEKYSISKLIGASAGYVGYESGGLLTEAVRKNPNSVLLLDEIEKAHDDIYNVLLQVMDYATLTDNQGRKADFRNVIIIMTSNIGADKVGKNSIGFRSERLDRSVMMEDVTKAFKPEFRNRLSKIVVFNSMDDKMAEMIINKKLGELAQMLKEKNIQLTVDKKAKALIKEKGISVEYGAREVERVIRNDIKPLFVDKILFGDLKNGGKIKLTTKKSEKTSTNLLEFCVI